MSISVGLKASSQNYQTCMVDTKVKCYKVDKLVPTKNLVPNFSVNLKINDLCLP